MQVSRSRRRTARFTVALTFAIFLAGMLVYTTFSAASPERFPDQIASYAKPGQTYRVGGNVLGGSIKRDGAKLTFKLGHPGTGEGKPITVTYQGVVPDTFREGRDILISVKAGVAKPGETEPAAFVGEDGSLLTKCPSKFNGESMNVTTPPPSETPVSLGT